jgi:exopolysaccharide biosynthesis polyprenyl glycosylphosphotransferase
MNTPRLPASPPPRKRQLRVFERRFLLMAGDTLAVLVAVLLALTTWVIVDGRGLGIRFVAARSYWFPILASLWLLLAHSNDFYSLRVSARIDATLMRLVQVTLQLWVLYLIIFFFSPRDALPRLFILYYGVLSFMFIAAWRVVRPFLFTWIGVKRRALVVGDDPGVLAIIEAIREEAPDVYAIAPLALDFQPPGSAVTGLVDEVWRENASEIILVQRDALSGSMFQAILDCYEQGISIVPMPLLYEQITGRVPVEALGPQDLITLLPTGGDSLFDPYLLTKRVMDIMLSLAGLVVFAALLPVIAPILWLDSPGPIFYRQERVGKGGSTFRLVKLRSMIPDAEHRTGPQWASDGDPRVTRIGRMLRKTRLDEVPQLLNVLRGEMSLIGPRPERPEFVEELGQTIPFYRARHVVKPGITGWAQVRHPYGNTAEDALIKLQYDLYYIRHRSLALDLLIALRTVGNVFSLRGM